MIQVNTATKRGLSLLFPGSFVSPAQTRPKATTEAAIIAGKGWVFQASQETSRHPDILYEHKKGGCSGGSRHSLGDFNEKAFTHAFGGIRV